MAHAFRQINNRASGTGNPQTASVTTVEADSVIVVLLKTAGATDRAGGPLTLAGRTLTQANQTQKAATSPEAGCELWYLDSRCLPKPGTYTLSIPNTGALTIYWTVVAGQAASGFKSVFDGANGSNNTSTNPSSGTVVRTENGDIVFGVVASGAQDFDPATPSDTGFETGTGTPLGTFDDGTHGGGQQYLIAASFGSAAMGWEFATSDDWGCVAAAFKEVPDRCGELSASDRPRR